MWFIPEGSILEIIKGIHYEHTNLESKQSRSRTQRIIIPTQRIVGDVEDLIWLAQDIVRQLKELYDKIETATLPWVIGTQEGNEQTKLK